MGRKANAAEELDAEPILYRTRKGIIAVQQGRHATVPGNWDTLFNRPDLRAHLQSLLKRRGSGRHFDPVKAGLLPPIGSQEVWAAGVTYYQSRDARITESEPSQGGDFYARVYEAKRPEIFFKSTPSRVVGHGEKIRVRSDSTWSVPEPELAVAVNARGRIIGYTIGNDVSARDIEGRNPLYLPQAKVYNGSCALGPGVMITERPIPATTEIHMEVRRAGRLAFHGTTGLVRLKRTPRSLVDFLYRDNVFPQGCFLLTGTGIIPPNAFSLHSRDEVRIAIDSLGQLINKVQ